jgi:hypothetical protein
MGVGVRWGHTFGRWLRIDVRMAYASGISLSNAFGAVTVIVFTLH